MNEMTMVPCTNCGAGLVVTPSAGEVECSYCGQTTAVDPERFAEHQARAADGRAELAEGELALRDALAARYATGALSLALGYGLSVAYIFGPIYVVAKLDKRFDLPDTLGLLLMAFFFLGGMGFIALRGPGRVLDAYHRRFAAPRIAEAMDQIRSSLEGKAQQGECPSCGAPVQLPADSAQVVCAFCDQPLMATLGMVVVWEEDVRKRRRAWLAEAKKVLTRARIIHVAQAVLARWPSCSPSSQPWCCSYCSVWSSRDRQDRPGQPTATQ